MTVIAFRSRTGAAAPHVADTPAPLAGTFRSPRGRPGHMVGALRVHDLVIRPRGAFVTGVFTGELRDDDGSLIGVDTRRATVAADIVRRGHGYMAVIRPFRLDLMGITVDVDAAPLDPELVQRMPRGPNGVPS